MLLDELHAKRDAIERLSRQYGARRIRVFGSVARREERPESDIDFLVDSSTRLRPLCSAPPAHRPVGAIAAASGGIDSRARTHEFQTVIAPAFAFFNPLEF